MVSAGSMKVNYICCGASGYSLAWAKSKTSYSDYSELGDWLGSSTGSFTKLGLGWVGMVGFCLALACSLRSFFCLSLSLKACFWALLSFLVCIGE